MKMRRQALIMGLMVVFVRPSGQPLSGREHQVEAIRRRCPRRSGRRCHDIATRLLARLFASPTPRLASSEHAEAERSSVCNCRRERCGRHLPRHYILAAFS